MSDVERLLSEYIAEHRAGGEADPVAYLDRLEGTDRAELAELIDAYLARAPGRAWDEAAFAGSLAERIAADIGRSLEGRAGLWPALLPRLRDQARLTREQVVARLTEALGLGGAERAERKVAVYYHGMEQGTLDPRGVDDRVLAALATIYATSAEQLRRMAAPLAESAGEPEGAAAFARTARAAEDREGMPGPGRAPAAEPERWDEVDELFRGAG